MPVDLAARGSATVGGMTATNAGGTHVLRRGTMRRNVTGIEAVLGDGRVVSHLAGLDKDNTGYDLAGLLCGSEGTIGVVTRVRVRLIATAAHRVTALLALSDLDAAVRAVTALRAEVGDLDAAEYMVRPGVELVMERFGLSDPFATAHAVYVLVEAAGGATRRTRSRMRWPCWTVWSTARSPSGTPGGRSCGGCATSTPRRWPRSGHRASTT